MQNDGTRIRRLTDHWAWGPSWSSATPLTGMAFKKTSFRFPGDGIRNNNKSIGPFCCTGERAIVINQDGNPLGYIHFYSWKGQALFANAARTRSIAPDIEILVSGLADLTSPSARQVESSVSFLAEEMVPEAFRSTRAGGLYYTVTIEEAILEERQGVMYFDMQSVVVRVDVSP